MRELTVEELRLVAGGDEACAAAMGAFSGGAAGWTLMRSTAWGVRIGMLGGPAGALAGGTIGMLVGVAIHRNYSTR
jgi:hypothetical protein